MRERYSKRRSLPDLAAVGALADIRTLVESGSDIDERDPDGCTALHLAIGEGNREVAAFLLQHGATVGLRDFGGLTTLHWAILSDDVAMLGLASDIEVDAVDHDGRTPLSWAASQDAANSVSWLLSHGADPNFGDKGGWTPLHHAAVTGHVNVLIDLLEAGARTEARSVDGENALDLAVRLGQSEVVISLKSRERKRS